MNKLFLLVFVSIYSCNIQSRIAKNKVDNESYCKYLSSVINDTNYFKFTEYSIADKSIYPILDSVILLSEKCKYFDTKVKYLNSFRFGKIYENGKFFYSIDANLSPAQAIGLILLQTGTVKELKGGIFYYKNYLFAIPYINFGEQNELKEFPFIEKTDNILRIRAPKFFDEKVYSSYVTFTKLEGSYKIVDNETCGNQILIR
ncbi:MAG: hypothetical protein KDB92_03380 [Chitinophagaceae bacterium]|nr:hypothetical protein [Chitinophagaceae bacterium]